MIPGTECILLYTPFFFFFRQNNNNGTHSNRIVSSAPRGISLPLIIGMQTYSILRKRYEDTPIFYSGVGREHLSIYLFIYFGKLHVALDVKPRCFRRASKRNGRLQDPPGEKNPATVTPGDGTIAANTLPRPKTPAVQHVQHTLPTLASCAPVINRMVIDNEVTL